MNLEWPSLGRNYRKRSKKAKLEMNYNKISKKKIDPNVPDFRVPCPYCQGSTHAIRQKNPNLVAKNLVHTRRTRIFWVCFRRTCTRNRYLGTRTWDEFENPNLGFTNPCNIVSIWWATDPEIHTLVLSLASVVSIFWLPWFFIPYAQ